MKRCDVVRTIKFVGEQFGRVLACVCSEDYAAGYEQAVKDMVEWFEYKPYSGQKPKSQKMVLFGGAKGRRT